MTRKRRRPWLENLRDQVAKEAAKFGTTPEAIAEVKAAAEAILARMDDTDAGVAAVRELRKAELATEQPNLRLIRARVRNWKTLEPYPLSGGEEKLRLKEPPAPFDPETYKPVIRVRLQGGRIRLDFKKKGVSGLMFYMRLRGAAEWRQLGDESRAPFWDYTPLAQPGVPEIREYMACGIKGKHEIGVASEIVSVTYGG
ncbi:MAG: hypothetical protein WCO56_26505 [Verrucomicrobiota bacterium]